MMTMTREQKPFDVATINPSGIPQELLNIKGWIGALHDPVTGKKPPCDHNGKKIDVSKATGYTFDEILAAAKKRGFAGVGFMAKYLPDDCHIGDFDKCRDPNTGELNQVADDLILTIDTHTEISISNTGIRWLGRGSSFDQVKYTIDGHSLEIYTNKTTYAYCTFTGNVIDPSPVSECSGAIKLFIETAGKNSADDWLNDTTDAVTTDAVTTDAVTTDAVTIARRDPSQIWRNADTARRFSQLDSGETLHDTPSQSDFAYLRMLAFLTGKNLEAMRAAFESSGRMSEKSTAERWARRADKELKRAIATTDAVYKPKKTNPAVKPAIPDFQGIASAAADWMETLLTTQNGGIRSCISNIATILENDTEWSGVIGYNQFTGKIEKIALPPYRHAEKGEWSDFDDTTTAIWLSKKYGFAAATNHVTEAVNTVSRDNSFHPVQQYLESLVWDGRERLDSWLRDYLGAIADDDRYPQKIGKCWMISAVARIMRPGVKVDTMLILEGEQGIGKSNALKTLAYHDDWFTDAEIDVNSKDSFLAIKGKWIVEMAELDTLNRAEADTLKAFLTRPIDRYREPYGKRMMDIPRQCVFAGTGNRAEYLKDTTGARRFWPILCTEISNDSLLQARDQLWAEAVYLFKQGEPWWLENRLDFVTNEQGKRFDADVWEDIIASWLADKDETTTSEILSDCLGVDVKDHNKMHQLRVKGIMDRLADDGWQKTRFTSGTSRNKQGYIKL